MTFELLFVLGAAVVLSSIALTIAWEWRWRDATSRPPLPGSRLVARAAVIVDASIGMYLLRGLGERLRRRVGRDLPPAGSTSEWTLGPDDLAAILEGGTRVSRPARLTVAGTASVASPGLLAPAAAGASGAVPARPVLIGAERPLHPRALRPRALLPGVPRRPRVRRDMLAGLGVGLATVLALSVVPRLTGPESSVLGIVGAPPTSQPTPPEASPSSGPEAPGPVLGAVDLPSPSPSPEPSRSPEASPSHSPEPSPSPIPPSPTPTATPTSGPTATPVAPTPTPRGTPRPTPRPTPTPTPRPTPTPTPKPTPTPMPSPSPTPTPTPTPKPTPVPFVESFSAGPSSGSAPLAVSFSGSVADATSWTISFGDGTSVNGTGSSVSASHTYADSGTYVATLTATGAGGSDSQGTTVEVQ